MNWISDIFKTIESDGFRSGFAHILLAAAVILGVVGFDPLDFSPEPEGSPWRFVTADGLKLVSLAIASALIIHVGVTRVIPTFVGQVKSAAVWIYWRCRAKQLRKRARALPMEMQSALAIIASKRYGTLHRFQPPPTCIIRLERLGFIKEASGFMLSGPSVCYEWVDRAIYQQIRYFVEDEVNDAWAQLPDQERQRLEEKIKSDFRQYVVDA